MGTLHWGGGGGVPAKPGSYMYISISAYPEWNNVYRVLDIIDSKIGLVLAR